MLKAKKRSSSANGDNPPKPKTFKVDSTESKPKAKTFKPKSNFKGKPRDALKIDSTESKPKAKTFKPKSNFKGKPADAGKFSKSKGVNLFKKPGKPLEADAKPEKTDWRKFKQEKKDLKVKRKSAKDSYDVSVKAKQIYEQLKCKKTKDKAALVKDLYGLLKGDLLKKVVMAHDSARIVQCMLKCASPALRETISQELLPIAVDMAVSKYSHFCVLRMFKYGSPGIKTKLVDSFMGNIVRLACHNISSKILDHAYLTVATPKQKIYMRQEFYGDLYKKSKDESVKQLSDAYKDTPHMKAAILGSVKSNLEHVANKKLVDNSLVHAVILEYLKECEEDKMEETVTTYSGLVPLMLTTKEGCQAAVMCFWNSTPKNRRAIVKAIKEHLVKICTHEQGYVFVIAVANALDDTKATKKAVFDPIHTEIQTIAASQWGRCVIEWFVSPADKNSFHPNFIKFIEEGLKYGKKDKEVRRKEIFEQIEEPMAKSVADAPEFWFSNGHIGLVTANIINKLTSTHFTTASQALASLICKPDWTVTVTEEGKDTKESEESKTVGGIEDTGLHIALKKIIKHDAERTKQGHETFGSIVANTITDETVKHWLTLNRGCFVLLNIIENNNEDSTKPLKALLKAHVSSLKKQKTAGATFLLKKLEN